MTPTSTPPAFSSDLNLDPNWEDLMQHMQGIFKRQYYTETGPMVRELESQFMTLTHCAHAVAITNEWVALLMVLDTLNGEGNVLVPQNAPAWVFQALEWHPRLNACHVPIEAHTLQPSSAQLSSLIDHQTVAWILDHPLGLSQQDEALRAVAFKHRIPVISIDSDLMNGQIRPPVTPASELDIHIISLHQRQLISGIEGAVVCTHHEACADQLRVMRSSSGVKRSVPVRKTVNGRLSEAHAAIALASLVRASERLEQLQAVKDHYWSHLTQAQQARIFPELRHTHLPYLALQSASSSTGVSILPLTYQGQVQIHPEAMARIAGA